MRETLTRIPVWVPGSTLRIAIRIVVGRGRRWRAQALASAPDGLTDFELGTKIGRQQTSAGKRRGELRDAGLIVDSGRRRPAPSGSMAIVWTVKDVTP